ncbi:MAG TPA: DNA primase [Firmicutes bacterium]|nr:DNA primase [Bacillota bacterium]
MTRGLIPPELVEEIKDRTDIVNLVESYVPLTKKGRNFWGLCPFHLEDTPSFSVSPDKQIYYCFGCHKGGNAINFLMEYEHLSFPEALEKLAERAGIALPEKEMSPREKQFYDERRKLIAINESAMGYFCDMLSRSPMALEYLDRRGISPEMREKFALGYATGSWDGLKLHLKKEGFSEPDMVKAGVISRSESGRFFDRFRNRLMFPIWNEKGKVIAFVGRIIDDSQSAKYVNTEETILYHKKNNLYALNFAKGPIRDKEETVLMEGNLDVVSAHQFGVTNAVAPQGTALTEEQVKTLKRYCSRVYLAYDSDNAGKKATLKNMDLLIKHGFRVYVMEMPEGMDPDDVFHKLGLEAWNQQKEKSLSYMEYKIKVVFSSHNKDTAEGKADIVTELGPSLFALKDPVERSEYIRRIAEGLDIDEKLLHIDMQRKASQNRTDWGRDVILETKKRNKGLELAKEYVLRTAIENSDVFDEVEAANHWNFLTNAIHRAIIDIIRDHRQDYSWHFRDLADLAPEELKNGILSFGLQENETMTPNDATLFKDCWKQIRKEELNEQLKNLTQAIKNLANQENQEKMEGLLRKFDKIQQELRKI